jgi:hypothetical protein
MMDWIADLLGIQQPSARQRQTASLVENYAFILSTLHKLAAERDALKAENARLQEVLKSFAKGGEV